MNPSSQLKSPWVGRRLEFASGDESLFPNAYEPARRRRHLHQRCSLILRKHVAPAAAFHDAGSTKPAEPYPGGTAPPVKKGEMLHLRQRAAGL